jgi:hypothetical protein
MPLSTIGEIVSIVGERRSPDGIAASVRRRAVDAELSTEDLHCRSSDLGCPSPTGTCVEP